MTEGQIIKGLLALALDMGRVIRALDEEGSHSELWTQDGDYVADPRFCALATPTGVAASPCPHGDQKPEPSCKNRHQCWEPCGELGKSAEHARVSGVAADESTRAPDGPTWQERVMRDLARRHGADAERDRIITLIRARHESGWDCSPTELVKAIRAASPGAAAANVIALPLSDAQMLLSWMDETFGNEDGGDWLDEDAAAVGDALNKAIEDFKRTRAALAPSSGERPSAPAPEGSQQ